MSTFSEKHVANLRLLILLVLKAATGDVSVGVLKGAISKMSPNHHPSGSQVRAELRWLHERGIVYTRLISGAVEGAVITERGHDVASGREVITGVMVPIADDDDD